jgi:hypothetical protein
MADDGPAALCHADGLTAAHRQIARQSHVSNQARQQHCALAANSGDKDVKIIHCVSLFVV